ncbi:MAG: type IV pilus assembly protein PilM [Candidatus Omnitrophica bacterium]|nr:type IV pilus assembly protein PilM [Candidatus Omnitrophota bacterium]
MALGRRRILGIDRGSTRIRAVELERRGNGLVLIYYNELVSPPGLPPEERRQFLREEGRNFVRSLPTRSAFLSLPGRGILTRTLPAPNVPLKKLKDILKYEVQQQIPFPLEVVQWSFQILSQTPQNFNVLLGAAKKDLITEFLGEIAPFGVDLHYLDADFFALVNAFRVSEDFRSSGCQALLDIGAVSANLVIMAEEKILMRALTTSGDSITSAVAETEGLSFQDAEQKKREEGTNLGPVATTLESLNTEIQNSIDYWRFTIKGPEVENFYVCGGTAKMKGFRQFMEEKSRLKTEVFDPLTTISLNTRYSSLKEAGPELAVAIGLGLRGLMETVINIDFLPSEVTAGRELRENRPYIFLSLIMAGVVSLTPTIFINQERVILQSFLSEMDTQLKQYEKFKPEVEKLNGEIKGLQGNIGTIKGILDKKTIWLSRILEIGESLPSSRIYITNFFPGAPQAGAAPAASAAPPAGGPPGPPPEGGPPPEAPPGGPPPGTAPAEQPQPAGPPVSSDVMTVQGETIITDIRSSFADLKRFVQQLNKLDFVGGVDITSCEIDRERSRLIFTLALKFK